MPELPEAETIIRTLAPRLVGRRIVEIKFRAPRARGGEIPLLEGRSIQGLKRYGKQIMLILDEGLLIVELRMTGALIWGAEPGPYTRALLVLDNGTVCFNDIRQFGSIRWLAATPSHLGPDPFDIGINEFIERLRARRGHVKPLLLNQRFVRGLGNIYVDEILFRAGIHPLARASRLTKLRVAALHKSMLDILHAAIEKKGSSISDYVDADNQRGSFQESHLVYGRKGMPCGSCGAAIRRIVVGQRGTHYCPKCQRR